MSSRLRTWLPELISLAIVAVFPLVPLALPKLEDQIGVLGSQLTQIFVFAVLALGLNVVVGYTGLLHLGIAAFFGIGAYIAGILMATPTYPFDTGFIIALVAATAGTAAAGLMLGAPTLRLRGDYLALVTLGFGEVVKYSLRNLEEITNGTRGLSPIPPPGLPAWMTVRLEKLVMEAAHEGVRHVFEPDWAQNFRWYYYLNLGILAAVVVVLRNLENSRLGRAWVAIREDELAAACMGINAARVKLSAFAVGAALAGMAGCLYATIQRGTAQPDSYDFNRSIIILCCVILGGLGSLRGALLGVLILVGFDNVLTPWLDESIQRWDINPRGDPRLQFSSWRLMCFGLALILMMRFRPEGLWPSSRVRHEMHQEE
jgi:branched-chain amino acid transport system permease protein